MKSARTTTRRLLVVLLGGLGIVLAVTTGVALLSVQEPTLGDVLEVERSLSGNDSAEAPTVISSFDTETPETPHAGTASALLPNKVSTLDSMNPSAGPTPVGLVIPSIDVDAEVISQGIDARTGQMEVPHNVSDVAWYEYGPAPGESGSAVLAAHVDLAGQGPGVFFDLRTLEPGDLLEVIFSDGTSEEFRVEARTIYDKDDLPLDAIFSREGPPVLTLITCGGSFNASVESYDSNVVVFALPVIPVMPVSEYS